MKPFEPGRVRGVIFDMDGLLLDSERLALDLALAISAELGRPWPRSLGLGLVGLNSRDAVAVIQRQMGADYPVDTHQRLFGERYEDLIQAGRIPLKPGVEALFDLLDALAIPRAIATSTRRSRATPKLAGVGLAGRIHRMVCGDEVAAGKPAPDIYLAAAGLLGLAPADCLALEDSNAGIRAALAAGTRPLMVPDLLSPAEDVLAAGVPVFASLHEIAALFAPPTGDAP